MSKSGEDRSKILVVEDSKTQAALLKMMLESEDYAVDVVHSAEEALEQVRGGGYDVVLLDIVLPGLSGLEACRVLKEDPATRATSVVLVTQLTSPADMLDGLQAGADNYVTKPYEKTQILDRIGRLLRDAGDGVPASDQAVEFPFGGRTFHIGVDTGQVLNFLLPIVEALEAANRELETFTHALAHDLRNPLLIVTNFSHHLHEALGDSLDERQEDDLKRIRDAGRHMMYVMDDLRDFADVYRVEVRRGEVDLSSLAREVIDDLRTLVPDRNVRFEAEPGIKALGDRTLLRVLLANLLENAWKYTGPSEDAWIELGVAENEGEVPTYHVRDNGIGFDNANREIIFNPFKRLHARTEFAGSGLGLATVERIVDRHGGRVWGEGLPGEGAVFRFTLGSS